MAHVWASPVQPNYDRPGIILGGAPGNMEELDRALRFTGGDHLLIGVNFSTGVTPCDIGVYVDHNDRIWQRMKDCQVGEPEWHTRVEFPGTEDALRADGFDVLWHGLTSAGTASLTAVKIAKHLGLDPVFLCGVHIEASGYDENYASASGAPAALSYKKNIIDQWRQHWRSAAEDGYLANVYSLGGWTQGLCIEVN